MGKNQPAQEQHHQHALHINMRHDESWDINCITTDRRHSLQNDSLVYTLYSIQQMNVLSLSLILCISCAYVPFISSGGDTAAAPEPARPMKWPLPTLLAKQRGAHLHKHGPWKTSLIQDSYSYLKTGISPDHIHPNIKREEKYILTNRPIF